MPDFPGPYDIWDTISAPLAGLWQGLAPRLMGGKNLNFEQYVREKARKRKGQWHGTTPPGQVPTNWLGRAVKGR